MTTVALIPDASKMFHCLIYYVHITINDSVSTHDCQT